MTLATDLRRLKADVGELVERHERAKGVAEFSRYRDAPLAFITEVLHGEPWSRQVDIIESVARNPLTVVRSCNAAGKDYIAAHLALWFVYARGGLVLLTGPTERQVREIVMREVARAFGRAQDLPGELYQMALKLGREEHAGILAFTSSEASKLSGFHGPKVMACLTEAQALEEWCWEGLLACTTGSDDKVLAVGNPLTNAGKFFTASQSDAWHAIRISAEEHPNVRERRVVVPGGPSVEFCERIASEFGRSSGIYRARVDGEFPLESMHGLIRRSWLESAAERSESGALDRGNSEPFVGCDIARFGPDASAVAVVEGPVLVEPPRLWYGADIAATVDKIETHARAHGMRPKSPLPGRWPPSDFPARGCLIVDEIGLGSGVLDFLRRNKWDVEGFNAARSPLGGDQANKKYANLRAQSYWHLRKLLDEGAVAMPWDEDLATELTATEWKPDSMGRIRIEPKEELSSRLGRSPDRADCVSMAFFGSRIRQSRMMRVQTHLYGGSGHTWA
jgi:hypothetical protein